MSWTKYIPRHTTLKTILLFPSQTLLKDLMTFLQKLRILFDLLYIFVEMLLFEQTKWITLAFFQLCVSTEHPHMGRKQK